MITILNKLRPRKRFKTTTMDKAMAQNSRYYLDERNRCREALIKIAAGHRTHMTFDQAEQIAAQALRLYPHGKARWATWDETDADA